MRTRTQPSCQVRFVFHDNLQVPRQGYKTSAFCTERFVLVGDVLAHIGGNAACILAGRLYSQLAAFWLRLCTIHFEILIET